MIRIALVRSRRWATSETTKMKVIQMKKRMSKIGLAIICVLLGSMVVTAQKTVSPERGVNPGNSYSMSDVETISQGSGNMMLNVPLASLPAGRGSVGGGVSLNYNSKVWDVQLPEPVAPEYYQYQYLVPSTEGDWRYTYGKYDLKDEYRQLDTNSCTNTLYLITPDGGKHLLWQAGATSTEGWSNGSDPDGTFECTSPPTFRSQTENLSFYTLDGTFMRVMIEGDNDGSSQNNRWTVYLPDGTTVVHNPGQLPDPYTNGKLETISDRNGNSVDVMETASDTAFAGHKTTTLKDDFDRRVVIEYEYDHLYHPSEDLIHSTGYNGAALSTRVKWKSITVNRTYEGCIGCVGMNMYLTLATSLGVVDRVYLPGPLASEYYEFNYNADATTNPSTGWGEVSQVKLPSGAYSTYNYSTETSPISVEYDDILRGRPTQKTLNYLKEYDGSSPLETETWTYSGLCDPDKYSPSCSTTAPDGSITTEYYGGWNGSTIPTPGYYNEGFKKPYKSISGSGVVTERVYANNIPGEPTLIAAANQFVKYEMTSIPDGTGTLTKTAVKEFSQDKNGNTTTVKEYDFLPYSGTGSVTRDSNGRPTGLPSGVMPLRITQSEFYNDTPDSTLTTYDADSYHQSTSARLLSLVKAVEVQSGGSVPKSRSEITYDYTDYSSSNTKAGNATVTKVWDSTIAAYSNPLASNYISTLATYNNFGMVTQSTDARGTQSTITYGDVMVGSASVQGPYPTETQSASNRSGLTRTSSATYDFSTGLTLTTGDSDNHLTNKTEYDALGRPTKAITAYGDTTWESWTTTEYNDASRYVVVKSDLEAKGDGKKVAAQFYDQLGRVRLSKTLEDASTQSVTNAADGIKVQTRYATATGYTYQLTSNPYRAYASTSETDTTMGWTRSKAWANGRESQVQTFSGAGLPAPWGSNTSSTGVADTVSDVNATTVTDQAGKLRRSVTNALGQLVRVDEPDGSSSTGALGAVASPNQSTSYAYDTLNNLTTVTEGAQTRSFTYDSFSRLTNATNPESGTISYDYDPNGNLAHKTDARSVMTTYSYDYLNRVTDRSYNDSPQTPAVHYDYDDKTHAKGKLTKVSSSVSTTEYTSFDILGRVTGHKQTTDDGDPNGYATAYSYKMSGALDEETYPSTRVVKNVLGNNGDLTTVKSKKVSASSYLNYASNFTYDAAGAVTSMELGNLNWESTVFNSRLQPTHIAVGKTSGTTDLLDLAYTYGSTDNNGNILSQAITVRNVGSNTGFTAAQAYSYDSLNRIHDAEEHLTPTGGTSSQSWKQTFIYDRYGNRNFDTSVAGITTTIPSGCSVAVCNPTITADHNQITSTGYSYDSSGNTTRDASDRKFTYDAENKQIKVEALSSGTNTVVGDPIGEYSYDGDGKRVKKKVGDEITIFVYDAAGKQIAEYSTTVINSTVAKVIYLTNDHLGSPRIDTDRDGLLTSRHDYHPFGEEIGSPQRTAVLGYTADTVRKQFTGYERDTETDLDFAQARTYSSSTGRMLSADPLYIHFERLQFPQALNLYSYTRNNPLLFTDPSGMDVQVTCKVDKDHQKVCQQETAANLNNREGKKFDIEIKNGRLAIAGKVDLKALDARERKLYDVITDTTPGVTSTLNVYSKSDQITFGKFESNGVNSIDLSDLSALNSVDKRLGGEVVAHEVIEGASSGLELGNNGEGYDSGHREANKYFGEAENPVIQLPEGLGGKLSAAEGQYNFGRLGISVSVTKNFTNDKGIATPVPVESLRGRSLSSFRGDVLKATPLPTKKP
jgi:RHS repeat-associated protein